MKTNFTVWWLNPLAVFAAVSVVLGAAAFLIPETIYQDLWFTPKFLDSRGLVAVLTAVAAFTAGAALPAMRLHGWLGSQNPNPEPELSAQTVLKLYRAAVALALAGYGTWAAVAISRGLNLSVLADVVDGKPLVLYGIRLHYLGNIPGITTCTQFAVAAAVLGPLAAAQIGWRPIWKSLGFLLFLGLVRAILNTERLAMVELAVPMLVVIVTQVLGPLAASRRWLRATLKAAPLAAIAALFAVFSGFEYFRSWTSYYAAGDGSFWQFAASRLIGYYVTAFNNGAYLVDRLSSPMGVPYFTGAFLWRFPFLKDITESLFPAFQISSNYFNILQSGANAEFNNGGGLFGPLVDFGSSGAILYWAGAGAICGTLYRRFRRGCAWGLCVYPVLFLGILDVPRGLYWAGGRAIPPLCFLMLSAFLLRIQQKRATAVRSLPR
jgi:hypothetical protein